MMRLVLLVGSLVLSACASGASGSAGGPLIMSSSVSQEVRQAATCYAFNEFSDEYVFGVQAETTDYAEAATFWKTRFEAVEPEADVRDRLLVSAKEKMDADFPRRSVPQGDDGARVQVLNMDYLMVVTTCEQAREQLEALDG